MAPVVSDPELFHESLRGGYSVRLDGFEGPLDLLLHLIKKNEVDIYNIPISEITRQYLEYIDLMKELNLDVAGEFLVLASTLLQIKSRMLLPPAEGEGETDGDEAEDPRAELVRRLIEYQRYREAARDLDRLPQLGRDHFTRGVVTEGESDSDDLPTELDVYLLVEAFRRLVASIPPERLHEVGSEQYRIADRISEILTLLESDRVISFDSLFPPTFDRGYLIVTFLAVLELCRLRTLTITQVVPFGEIWLTRSCGAREEAGDEVSDADVFTP
ncbi:MAG: segregation/condensation protein A [Desulfuromonadia bacterium]